jgi:hypothetical protein
MWRRVGQLASNYLQNRVGRNGQDVKFFDRLYLGFEAEYLVASSLFGAGLEAFKLPGDFGFDLLVSQQLDVLRTQPLQKPSCGNRAAFPYALQVKSRRARADDVRFADGSERRELETTFVLKKHEYDLLISSDNAFLVGVPFLPSDERLLSARSLSFWLGGKQLLAMYERGYLSESLDESRQIRLTLHVVFRLLPMLSREVLIDDVVGVLNTMRGRVATDPTLQALFSEAADTCRSRITQCLPDFLESKRAGNEYIAFRRRSWSKAACAFGDDLDVPRMLKRHQADLSRIGMEMQPFPIDDAGVESHLEGRKLQQTHG